MTKKEPKDNRKKLIRRQLEGLFIAFVKSGNPSVDRELIRRRIRPGIKSITRVACRLMEKGREEPLKPLSKTFVKRKSPIFAKRKKSGAR